MITDQELADAFFAEWKEIEKFRLSLCVDLLEICRHLHMVQAKLTEKCVQVLVEDKWREGEVTKHLAGCVMSLMAAIKSIENNTSVEVMFEPDPWPEDEETDDGVQ